MGKYQDITSKSELKNVSLPNCIIEMCKNSSVFHGLSKLNSVEQLTIYCLWTEPLPFGSLKLLENCFLERWGSLSLFE